MITIPTLLAFAAIAVGFVGVPAGLSLFSKNQKLNKILSTIGMVAFCGVALLLTLPSVSFNLRNIVINFSPTSPWFNRMFGLGFDVANVKDVLLNCFMLAPLGVMVTQHAKAKNKKRTILKSLLAGLALGLFIEISQMILPFGRFPTLTDAVCNSLSAGIGCVCLHACHKIKNFFVARKNKKNKQKALENVEEKALTYSHLEQETKKLDKKDLKEQTQSSSESLDFNELEHKTL